MVASLGSPRLARPIVSSRVVGAFALLGTCVCAISVVFVVSSAPPDERLIRGVTELLVIGVPLLAGLYALATPRTARCGSTLLATSFVWSLTALGESGESVPYTIGRVSGWLVFPGLILLMLTFPDGRIERRADRALLLAFNAVLFGLFVGSAFLVERFPEYTPWATCIADCPLNAFMLVDREPAFMHDVVTPVRELLGVAVFAGAIVSIAHRMYHSTPLQRRVIWPLLVTAGASVLLLAAFFIARRAELAPGTIQTLGILWGLCFPAIAAAFLAGLLRRRLLFGRVLADLAAQLSEGFDLPRVRDGLAGALRDPRLNVLVADGPVRWRDASGVSGPLPVPPRGRELTIVGEEGAPAVAIDHDAGLRSDDELLHAVASLVLGTVRHHHAAQRLVAALQALEQSRRRIAEAADQERARIERDLHDGAQQRLMALRIRLSLAEELLITQPPAGIVAVHELGDEVERTLDELRSLAHGVYPAVLNDRGLADALRSVGGESPLPVHLHTRGVSRYSRELETAVYFTCLEALQNASKHARTASGVWILLIEVDGVLTIEVRDDGVGFTVPADGNGSSAGLRNMRDRLEAIGGQLTIDAAPGRGTRILGRLPLD